MTLTWKNWWRSLNGEVRFEKAFSFPDDPDWWYFGIDPENQIEQISDNDENRVHEDDLFYTEQDAKDAAIEWLSKQERELINKAITLRMWSGFYLIKGY